MFGELHLFRPQGCPMDALAAGLVGGSVADGGLDNNQGRLVGDFLGFLDGLGDPFQVVVAILYFLHMPAVGFIAFAHIFRKGDFRSAVDGDVVAVVKHDQLAQLQVAGQRSCFRSHPFHVAAIPQDHVSVVIHNGVAGLVEAGGQMGLGNGQPYRIAHPLPQRAGGHLHPRSFKVFRVAGGFGAPLAELLDVL